MLYDDYIIILKLILNITIGSFKTGSNYLLLLQCIQFINVLNMFYSYNLETCLNFFFFFCLLINCNQLADILKHTVKHSLSLSFLFLEGYQLNICKELIKNQFLLVANTNIFTYLFYFSEHPYVLKAESLDSWIYFGHLKTTGKLLN